MLKLFLATMDVSQVKNLTKMSGWFIRQAENNVMLGWHMSHGSEGKQKI